MAAARGTRVPRRAKSLRRRTDVGWELPDDGLRHHRAHRMANRRVPCASPVPPGADNFDRELVGRPDRQTDPSGLYVVRWAGAERPGKDPVGRGERLREGIRGVGERSDSGKRIRWAGSARHRRRPPAGPHLQRATRWSPSVCAAGVEGCSPPSWHGALGDGVRVPRRHGPTPVHTIDMPTPAVRRALAEIRRLSDALRADEQRH